MEVQKDPFVIMNAPFKRKKIKIKAEKRKKKRRSEFLFKSRHFEVGNKVYSKALSVLI